MRLDSCLVSTHWALILVVLHGESCFYTYSLSLNPFHLTPVSRPSHESYRISPAIDARTRPDTQTMMAHVGLRMSRIVHTAGSMTRQKGHPYTCIRCGYATAKRDFMNRHFYHNKNVCPSIVNDIELTDAIREHILKNRVYHKPEPRASPTIHNTINAYNTKLNFVQ